MKSSPGPRGLSRQPTRTIPQQVVTVRLTEALMIILCLESLREFFFKRGKDGAGPTVEGKGITLPFRDVLLDRPRESEGDFVLTSQMLLEDLVEGIRDTIDEVEKMP